MLHDIAVALQQIGANSGRLTKEALLRKHSAMPGFKETLKFIYDPLVRTGIAEKKLANGVWNGLRSSEETELFHVMDYLKRYNTGADYAVALAIEFIKAQHTEEAKWLARCIVTQDLKIGVTETTLNNVYGAGFIPVIGCMLGKEYSKVKDKMRGVYISSRKIDGQRRLLIKENGKVSMYTRNGLPDEGLVDIEREAAYLPDNTVYDGELEAIGDFTTNLERRQATNSIGNSKGIRTGVTYNIFDMVPLDEFKEGKSKNDALVRKLAVETLFGLRVVQGIDPITRLSFIRPVPIFCIADDINQHIHWFKAMMEAGEEGIMMIQASSKYEPGKRSNDWVKMKRFKDIDLEVMDLLEGDDKYTGMLGSVLVRYKGHDVKVGSGFSDYQRKFYWDNPNEILHKIIEITHQGESSNKTGGLSLNCPIFKGVRLDKTKGDKE